MLLKLYEKNNNPQDLQQIVDILNDGGLIIYPTDTMYAIGCHGLKERAIERICRIKEIDPRKNNLSIICYDLSSISEYAKVDNNTFKLMKRNLPGAFTFILNGTTRLPKIFRNRKEVGIRMPDNAIIQEIARVLDAPIMTTTLPHEEHEDMDAIMNTREIRDGGIGGRAIEALLEGGKNGVDVGLAIIPGVITICTLVMMLTNGASADGTYTGAAYEGIAFLPWLGKKLEFILSPLFGFTDASGISVPITALGAAGAAIGLVPHMAEAGTVLANDVAVFTAMCMCWSGYLSTHVAMMSSLKVNKLTGKAILSHTIGGLCAGVAANWIFKLVMLFL